MSTGLLGRGLVLVGIVTGLLAVGLPYTTGSRYLDDGTQFAFLVILLSLASWLPADVGPPLFGAAAGAAAFGFYLFIPSTAAFDSFGYLDSGAWLGLCTVLIPVGALVVWAAEKPAAPHVHDTRSVGLLVSTVGLALITIGVWFNIGTHGPTYWHLASSGHAAGLLMLVLVVANALLIGAPAHSSMTAGNLDVLVAATTFGYVEVAWISAAFNGFGSLGAGSWLEACGGLLLIVGVLVPRSAWVRELAAAGSGSPAPSQ